MNLEKRRAIFTLLKKNTPNPTTELIYHSSFELLISVILSAQTTDIAVNKVTKKLFNIANTPLLLSNLKVDKIEKLINAIGLYKNKAKNIKATSSILLEKFNGEVPSTREELESLPGVGRKTANVILNTLFKKPVIAVDTHIFRLANRINIAPAKTPLTVEKRLTKLIPNEFLNDAHHLLILHGRYVCKAIKPQCSECVINNLCEYKKKLL
ncbi:endonuclease III [Methylophilaceae bacterium]|jgi:endonuclease-3|nr:endonuclease III [Nitrosomonadales bacterium]MBT6232607.1 endonuclease III [Nitrosomonadales bacterium]MCH9771762.1 endonuclease III [Betaproteobacteria bacterium]MDA9086678.1 endonuclease III [Methylophilaceae bacterium]|tara:strand:+ start:1472 stop:2104 length:633 start_codon:yes stop_codon:yes gene_type:complete